VSDIIHASTMEQAISRLRQGENLDALISHFNESEQEKFWELIYDQYDAILQDRDSELQKVSWEIDYIRRPPTIEEFIDSDFWLGKTHRKAEDNVGVFPAWRDILLRDFDLDSRLHNLVITGSLGCGKTFMMVTMLLYRLAVATMLKNPQHFFGLSAGTMIIYNFLSVTKGVVTETAFGDAINFMSNSEFFTKEIGFDADRKYADHRIPMRNNIWLTAGSKGWHVLGRNTLGIAMDEGNWRNESNPDESAYQLFNEVRTRISNRFRRSRKFLPAISILASSSKDETSFTERVIEEIEKTKDPKSQTVYRNAIYKIKPPADIDQQRWFKVCYGLKNMEPFILSGWYAADGEQIQTEGIEFENPPDGAKTELVPEMYIADYKRNCRVALQGLSGISTGGTNKWFSTLVDVESCVEKAQKEGVVKPTLPGIDALSISMEDNKNIWDYLDHKSFLTKVQSRIQPKRHPDALRFAHIDLATTSMAGVAICHLVGHQLVEGLVKDGVPYNEYRLIVEYDFILTIIAGRVKPISLEKIQRFFFWLRNECNYHFGLVTADQYQSDMPLQMMEARGFNVDKLSVDRDKTAYMAFRRGFEELCVRPYRQPFLMTELENLLDADKKVDHPPNGSKDTSDAVCGAYVNAINSDAKKTMSVHNAPGLYGDRSLEQAMTDPDLIHIPLPQSNTSVKIFEA
jgi:hypothetical protein